jgi:hypothetical protein
MAEGGDVRFDSSSPLVSTQINTKKVPHDESTALDRGRRSDNVRNVLELVPLITTPDERTLCSSGVNL